MKPRYNYNLTLERISSNFQGHSSKLRFLGVFDATVVRIWYVAWYMNIRTSDQASISPVGYVETITDYSQVM